MLLLSLYSCCFPSVYPGSLAMLERTEIKVQTILNCRQLCTTTITSAALGLPILRALCCIQRHERRAHARANQTHCVWSPMLPWTDTLDTSTLSRCFDMPAAVW